MIAHQQPTGGNLAGRLRPKPQDSQDARRGSMQPLRAAAKSFPPAEAALEMALNEHCDAVVATVIVGRGQAAALEQPALDFLASDVVLRWAERTLGL